jgi:hypothetical protein
MAEQIDEPAGRPQGQEQEFQQRGLAGAGRTGEKLEGMGGNFEIEVAQNLRAQPVTQADIFEPNQAQLRSMEGAAGNLKPGPGGSASLPPRTKQSGCASFMVSDSLTLAL